MSRRDLRAVRSVTSALPYNLAVPPTDPTSPEPEPGAPAAALPPIQGPAREPPAPDAEVRRADRWWLLALLLLTVLVYGPSLGHGYAIDSTLLVAPELPDGTPNPFTGTDSVFQGGERSLGDYLTANYWAAVGVANQGLYRPLPILSYAFGNALGVWLPGGDAFWQHLINLLLHLLGLLLVFRLAGRFGLGAWPRLAATAVCALHSIRVEAVADVVGRAELLAFCAGLGGVLLWLRGAGEAPPRGPQAWLRCLAAAMLWWLAFVSKESALTWPAVAVVMAWARRHGESPGLPWWQGLPGLALRALLVALPAVLVWWWLRAGMLAALPAKGIPLLERPEATVNELAYVELGTRLMTAIKIWAIGFLRLLVPWPLVADRSTGSWDLVTSPWDPGFLAGLLGLLLLAWAAWRLRRGLPVVSAGIALLFGMGLITSNLLFPVGVMAADRLWYGPLLGLALVLLGLVQRRVGFPTGGGRLDTLWRYGLPIWLAGLMALSAARVPEWRDNETLLTTDTARAPGNPRLQELLAAVYVQRMDDAVLAGDARAAREARDRALEAYRAAVAGNPGLLRSWHGLSRLLFQGNDPVGALRALNDGLMQDGPDAGPVSVRVDMLTNRAGLLEAARPRDAVRDLERALELEPDHVPALQGILQIGDGVLPPGRWRMFLTRLQQVDPDGMETRFHTAEWAFQQGDYGTVADELRTYSRVLRERPVARRAEALLMQAEALNRLGRFAEGNRAAQRILEDDEMGVAAKRRAEALLR